VGQQRVPHEGIEVPACGHELSESAARGTYRVEFLDDHPTFGRRTPEIMELSRFYQRIIERRNVNRLDALSGANSEINLLFCSDFVTRLNLTLTTPPTGPKIRPTYS
jgi:hypothetical protein